MIFSRELRIYRYTLAFRKYLYIYNVIYFANKVSYFKLKISVYKTSHLQVYLQIRGLSNQTRTCCSKGESVKCTVPHINRTNAHQRVK